MNVSQLAIAVLGVLVITGEYSTGMIRASLIAVPNATAGAVGEDGGLRRRQPSSDAAVGEDEGRDVFRIGWCQQRGCVGPLEGVAPGA